MDPLTVARFEEGSHARSALALAPESMELANGAVVTFAEPGSWLNRAWNLGLHGPVSAGELDAVVSFFEVRQVDAVATICSLVDDSVISGLADRNFALQEFLNVFVRDIGEESIDQPVPWPPGLVIDVVDPDDDESVDRWVRASISGFHDGVEPPEAMMKTAERVVRRPAITAMLASVDGRPAGGATMSLPTGDDPVRGAGLFGTSVRAEFRGRGIQQLLMYERLRLAQARGAELATIASKPGIPTERNAERLGFSLSYVKVVMARTHELW